MDKRDRVLSTLSKVFHHDGFKSKTQENAVRCVAGGMTVFLFIDLLNVTQLNTLVLASW